jgi:tetratricopeptide (TPR) repeat protein
MVDVNQLLQKATRLYSKGKINDASKIYQKVVRQAPKFVDAINMYGITLAQLGELPAAADQFSTIIKLEPGKTVAYENLARVYLQMKQYAQAQTLCEQGLGFSPGSYNLHFSLATALMSQLDYECALESFNKAKAINAADPLLFINMGTTLSQLGQSSEAINAFQQAILLDPNSAEAYLRLGQLYIVNNNFLLAEEALIKACRIRDDSYHIHLSLADAYQQNSKHDLAIKHYFAADTLQPGSQNVYTKLDKLILHSGSKEKASLLDSLEKERVYDDWSEAVDDAKRLAQLLEYPDENALAVLRRFFNKYNPAILHEREWWQQELKRFGDAKYGHDKILRGIHSAVFSWSCLIGRH